MADENNIWDLLPGTDMVTQEEDEANQEQEEIDAAEAEETPIEEVETDADVLLNDIFENLDGEETKIIEDSGSVDTPPMGSNININGVSVALDLESEEKGKEEWDAQNEEIATEINEIKDNPIYTPDGAVDIKATQEAIDNVPQNQGLVLKQEVVEAEEPNPYRKQSFDGEVVDDDTSFNCQEALVKFYAGELEAKDIAHCVDVKPEIKDAVMDNFIPKDTEGKNLYKTLEEYLLTLTIDNPETGEIDESINPETGRTYIDEAISKAINTTYYNDAIVKQTIKNEENDLLTSPNTISKANELQSLYFSFPDIQEKVDKLTTDLESIDAQLIIGEDKVTRLADKDAQKAWEKTVKKRQELCKTVGIFCEAEWYKPPTYDLISQYNRKIKEIQNIAKSRNAKITQLTALLEGKEGDYPEDLQNSVEQYQTAFTNYINKEYSKRLSSNKTLTAKYKEYGIVTEKILPDIYQQHGRLHRPELRDIDIRSDYWENQKEMNGLEVAKQMFTNIKHNFILSTQGKDKEKINILSEIPQFEKGKLNIEENKILFRETTNKFLAETSIALRDFFGDRARFSKDRDNINNLIETTPVTLDMTIGEAAKHSSIIKGMFRYYNQGMSSFGQEFNENMTVKEFRDSFNIEIEDIKALELDDYENWVNAYKEMSFLKDLKIDEDFLSIEGFMQHLGMAYNQALHMVPSYAGQAMMMTGTGMSFIPTPQTQVASKGLMIGGGALMAAGATIQGAMTYSSVFMEGVRIQLTEELGQQPTAQQFFEALQDPKYGDQLAAAAAGGSVMFSELFSDLIFSRVGGKAGTWMFTNSTTRKMMQNSFQKYIINFGTSAGVYGLNMYKEWGTEGFQEWLEQGFTHMAMGQDNPFTSNIDWDQISEAAQGGWDLSKLFGMSTAGSALLGQSAISDIMIGSYNSRAKAIVSKLRLDPGSKTASTVEKLLQNLKNDINNDGSLNKKQKNDQILSLSNIRSAALSVSPEFRSQTRLKLINLIIEQKNLEKNIKRVNNKQASVLEIERKNEVDAQIQEIILAEHTYQQALEGPTQAMGMVNTGAAEDLNSLAKEYKKNPGSANIESLLNQYQKIALKALGFDSQKGTIKREDAVSFVDKEFGKILDSWDPAQGSLSNWITSNIAPKKSAFYGKEQQLDKKGKETSLSDERARELQAEETQETQGKEFENRKYPTDIAAIEKQTANVRPEILRNIKNSVKQFIASSVGKVKEIGKKGKTAITKLNPSSLVKELKAQNRATRAAVRDAMGKSVKAQNDFIKKVINDGYIETIPIAAMKKRFKTVKGFNIEKIGRETLGAGTGIYKLSGLQEQALIDFYTKDQSGRRSFIDLLAKGLTIEQFQEVKTDPEFMNDLDFKLKEAKSELTAEEFMNEVEKDYDGRTREFASLDKIESLKKETKPKTEETQESLMALPSKTQMNDVWGGTAQKGIDNLISQYNSEYFNLSKKEKLEIQLELFKALIDAGIDPRLFVQAVSLSQGYKFSSISKTGGGTINYITALDKLQALKEKDAKIREDRRIENEAYLKKHGKPKYKPSQLENRDADFDRTIAAYKKGEIGSIKEITTLLESILKKKKFKADKDMSLISKGQTANTADKVNKLLNKNIDNYNAFIRGKNKLFNGFRKLKTKLLGPLLDILYGKSSFNQNLGRMLSPVLGKLANYAKGAKITLEHTFQFNNYTRILGQALRAPKAVYNEVIKYLNANMFQIAMTGTKQEKNYNGIAESNIDIFDNVTVLPNWFAKSQLNPRIWEEVKLLLAGKMKANEMTSALYRIFNRNFYENPNIIEVYNPKTGKVESVAKQHNTLVPGSVTIKGKKYTAEQLMAYDKSTNKAFYPNVEKAQAYATVMVLEKNWTKAKAKQFLETEVKIALEKDLANLKVQEYSPGLLEKRCSSPCRVPRTSSQVKKTLENSLDTQVNAQKVNKKKKGISVFDFDDTLAKTKEKVIVYAPAFKPGTSQEVSMELTPAEFAEQAQELEDMGASFDFSQFEKVKGAKKGPLADLALRRQGKFGSGDIFVLTARPQTSAQGIKTFLDGIGLNIPLENITGLEDGTSQAKADWVLQKTEKGYNDFYFADDAIQNVTAVKQILDQVDVKSKVQQAIADKTINLDKEFNKQIEEVTGKEAYKEYSPARARLEGKAKDKGFFKWLGKQITITPSAEDFMGLMYDIIGKGKQGNRHAQFIADNLMNPYNKAEQAILSAKVTVANDFAALKKAFPSLKTKRGKNPLMQEIGVGPYTKSNALRVYIWNKQGMEIPGLSKRDQTALVEAVETDMELKSFADNVILIQKESTYPAPGNNWTGGDITTDILQGLDKGFRNKLMTEFNENAAIIFSEKNMNKLEAIYGTKWTEALKDSLRRMKVGSNRPVYQGGGSRIVNELLDWLNGSVGAIMFLNMRSGLLQTISNINFINWGDNNIYAAAKAFASKEYWPTVMKLMNSDYLVNRRDGLKINVNEAELADAAKKSGMKGAIAYMLDKGFIITRIMDSLAIATGGATFYMNRRDALLKRQNPDTGKTYTKAEAEAKAFDDFYAISEESQQSSNPSKISQQQASLAGRVILSFQNVTMQYNRKVKKSIRNLYNRRKNPGQTQRESDLGNLSQVIYYTTIQNIIFHSLQQTLFALAFDDETEDEEKDRAANIANGMADSLLFGLGFGGAAISTVKNVLLKIMGQHEKKNPKYEEAVWSLFDFSPVLDSKVRKIKTGLKTFSWNMEEIKKRGWSLDNPAYLAVAQFISATTNIPIDRVLRKTMNLRAAMDEETRTWQRVALILGWDTWSVGLPYWGLQSTIKKEEKEKAKIKADYKSDIRKIKGMGYKKVMARVLKDYDPKDIIEMQSPAGTVVYYAKIKKK